MKVRGKFLRRVGILFLLAGLYPAFVLAFTWSHVLRSDFEGGGNGPLDAYRHALASSIVSYTLGESAVDLVSTIFESDGKDSNAMDRHNNRIGARIGSECDGWRELEPRVRQAVAEGMVNSADSQQITWLPEKRWRNDRWW